MVTVNEYFEGKVKSLVVNSAEGKKTVGVIEPGEYEFNTDGPEAMTVIAGMMSVYLPAYEEWEDFGAGSSFDVPAKSVFKVKTTEDAAYLCEYK
ncbi:MAG TPA: pyrimidine/purine nucleoside phosphorylase [Candidatus Omnitrophota bacterium]|nr:pyrimidine/purine nucleoside phosphorylase [Candidatus Omnitrophota bacterium]